MKDRRREKPETPIEDTADACETAPRDAAVSSAGKQRSVGLLADIIETAADILAEILDE